MDARVANDRIAEKAHRLHFLSRVPMLCECSRPGCQRLLMISLHDYRGIRSDPGNFLTAPGHEIEGAQVQTEASGFEIRRDNHHPRERDGGRRSA